MKKDKITFVWCIYDTSTEFNDGCIMRMFSSLQKACKILEKDYNDPAWGLKKMEVE